MIILFDEYRIVSSTKELPFCLVRSIKALGVDTFNVSHTSAEITFRRIYQQMLVVRHQEIRRNLKQKPGQVAESALLFSRLIDEEYTRHPFYGSRKMVIFLERAGRLMLEEIYHNVRRGESFA